MATTFNAKPNLEIMDERHIGMLTNARIERFNSVAAQRLNCLALVFENLTDPHNISACLRAAEAFGLTDVWVVGDASYECNESISMYADRWLEIHRCDDAGAVVAGLRDRGYALLAAVPSDDAVALTDLELPARTAVMVGNEKDGLCPDLIDAADVRVKIPMHGFTQSLNVSAATAVILQHLSQAYRAGGPANLIDAEARHRLVSSWCNRDISTKTRGYVQLD
mgnify:FL=1